MFFLHMVPYDLQYVVTAGLTWDERAVSQADN